ncbi:Uncharacterised protein [Salmonella enterica subsp. enterica serovar Bovismorbificans]|uniref:Uncharacterized protein n=1 Tax=Salmonella enterica subsp. enterica serovar Bovismorbificans TaxID=58097 RepID=A0A655BPW5_SALET|nr:Uncharacterised protein [Salmonella enterica subsp. enterica serovar Bovismorbificans]
MFLVRGGKKLLVQLPVLFSAEDDINQLPKASLRGLLIKCGEKHRKVMTE